MYALCVRRKVVEGKRKEHMPEMTGADHVGCDVRARTTCSGEAGSLLPWCRTLHEVMR